MMPQHDAVPSVCFVAPRAYAALTNERGAPWAGGAEVQQALIARELARRGLRVSLITLDHGQPDGSVHDGVRVFTMCRQAAGWPGIRFVHPRWSGLWAAMRRAAADVYCQRGAGLETGQVALWCKRHRRPFLFAAASDSNADPTLPDLRSRRERLLYRYGLRRAARIVCQTARQAETFAALTPVKTVTIASCCSEPNGEDNGAIVPRNNPRPRVLWVGRPSYKKRFDWLLDLAGLCPDWHFDVVGIDRAHSERAHRRPANVKWHGVVRPEQMPSFYRAADVLVCTSSVEGFPNSFLEAWARGVPTVSTFDPDGLIARHGLGAVADSVSGLRSAIGALVTDPKVWTACARQARAYRAEHHSVAASADAYAALACEVVDEMRARRAAPREARTLQSAGLRYEVGRGLGGIDALAGAWTAGAHAGPLSPVADPIWYRSFWEAFGDSDRDLFLHAVYHQNRLAAVMPLLRSRGLIRAWRGVRNAHNPYWMFYLDLARPEACAELLSNLLASVDYVDLPPLHRAGPLHRALTQAAVRLGCPVAERDAGGDALIELKGPWDVFRRTLSGQIGQTTPRRVRQLEKLGELRFAAHTDASQLMPVLEACYELESAGWKGVRGEPIKSNPRTHRFYTQLALRSAEAGRFALYTLHFDGRLIAFEYCLRAQAKLDMLKLSYDPQTSRYSPGNVLRYLMLQREIEHGEVATYHLGRPSQWKEAWATRIDPLVRLSIYRPGLRGRVAYYAGPRLRAGLKGLRNRVRPQRADREPPAASEESVEHA